MQGTSASATPAPTHRASAPPESRPPAWANPLPWAILSVLAFCWLAQEAAIEGEYIAMEAQWMARVFSWRSPVLDGAVMWLKRMHDPAVVAFIVGGIGLHAWQRRWQQVRWLVAVVPGGMLANLALKAFFHRARPEFDAMVHAHGYSFPSGHAMAATLMAAWLAYTVFQGTRHAAWRAASVVAGVALVCSVAFSRVYLGVHYPMDVLAAVLAGAAWFFICLALRQALGGGAGPQPMPRLA